MVTYHYTSGVVVILNIQLFFSWGGHEKNHGHHDLQHTVGHDIYEMMRLGETNTLALVLVLYLHFIASYSHPSDGDLT